jgi:hypothetical protein
MFNLIFLVVALVLFILAAVNVPSDRVGLGWAGCVFLTLHFLFVAGGIR